MQRTTINATLAIMGLLLLIVSISYSMWLSAVAMALLVIGQSFAWWTDHKQRM